MIPGKVFRDGKAKPGLYRSDDRLDALYLYVDSSGQPWFSNNTGGNPRGFFKARQDAIYIDFDRVKTPYSVGFDERGTPVSFWVQGDQTITTEFRGVPFNQNAIAKPKGPELYTYEEAFKRGGLYQQMTSTTSYPEGPKTQPADNYFYSTTYRMLNLRTKLGKNYDGSADVWNFCTGGPPDKFWSRFGKFLKPLDNKVECLYHYQGTKTRYLEVVGL
jgi:hypothetical protein